MNQNAHSLALVPQSTPSASLALEPTDLDSAYRLAQLLAESKILGTATRIPQAALAVMMTGRELGMTTMQSLRGIHVIEGKPTLSADTMAALVLQSSRCESWELLETTNTIATYETKRRGAKNAVRMSFTLDDAKTAGDTRKVKELQEALDARKVWLDALG